MKPGTKLGLKWLAAVLLASVAIYAFFPLVTAALGAGVGLAMAAVYLAAYVFTIVVVPLFFIALARFVYSLWLKPYYRAWHINRIRNARHLREVLNRGNIEDR